MTSPDQPDTVQPLLRDSAYVTAMSHFYRGELGRIMVWRQRLDITTTWAITTSTTIFTVAFTIRDLPHIIFFFNIAIVWIMLWIEARRYRFYDAFRARVRMLEAHFLVPILTQSDAALEGNWKKLVAEDLILPRFKITKFEAVGRRLKRNYIFIFGIVLAAWITKIFMHSHSPITSVSSFYANLAVSGIPSWLVLMLIVVTFISMTGISLYIARSSSGEVSEFGTNHTLWRL